MVRFVSTYLTKKEERQLKAYCKKHGLTKYRAFKTALARLLTEEA